LRICIAGQSPGGIDGVVNAPLEESEVLDYYDVLPNGRFEHLAQTRQCAGTCSDAVEGIARREVKAVIVAGLSPNSLLKFHNAGIRVLRADRESVHDLLKEFTSDSLKEIGMDQFARLRQRK
jgi:predicted Fe-Mo cluster-binding NifX family protein